MHTTTKSDQGLPSRLNGYPVIAVLPRYRANGMEDDVIVLVHRTDGGIASLHQPFVVAAWRPRCGDSWDCGDYYATIETALGALVDRARTPLLKPEPEPVEPLPAGFRRMRVEIAVPIDLDPSALLEVVQGVAVDLADDDGTDELPEALMEQISDACSVQEAG